MNDDDLIKIFAFIDELTAEGHIVRFNMDRVGFGWMASIIDVKGIAICRHGDILAGSGDTSAEAVMRLANVAY